MKAEQIQKLQKIIDDSLLRRANHPLYNGDDSGLGLCFWLAEIALQLAVMNEAGITKAPE